MTSNLWHRSQAGKQACLVSIAILLLAGFCFSQPAISLSTTSGPPTTVLRVSGSGFAPYAKVDIYFGTGDKALAIADGSGSFSQIAMQVPASALPGTHWVSAVERSGQNHSQVRFEVRSDWDEFLREDMKRFNPYENVLNVNNAGSLDLKWSYATNGDLGEDSPAVANGVVYFSSIDDNVYALDAHTGAKLWSYPTGASVQSSPAVADGVVYVGSNDFSVYALNAHTGARLWSYATGGEVYSSPAVVDGVLYVGSGDGKIYALDAKTGADLWSYATGGAVDSSPAVANGVVYVGSDDDTVYALNAQTGADLWSYATGSYVSSPPSVANGVVYIGSWDGNVYALNAQTGAKLWSYLTQGLVDSSPAVANGVVYVGSGHNMYALNASNGVPLWSYATNDYVWSSPAVANGAVYVGSFNYYLATVAALDASTGATLWSTGADSLWGSPAVVNDVVYVGSADDTFYAFSLKHDRQVGGTAGVAQQPKAYGDSYR